jgi:uncharacterized protein (DUF305 family)
MIYRATLAVAAALSMSPLVACAPAIQTTPTTGTSTSVAAETESTAGSTTNPAPYGEPDVHFMSRMIHHHAQAMLLASWAPSHGAGPALRTLAERITVSQRDEILAMQRWLRERGLPVPGGDPSHSMMHGIEHTPMPGMLTHEQLAQLDRARGADFDRLFLAYMIQHHQGAVSMVDELLRSAPSARDSFVFRFASDVHADQTAEINRMVRMLATLPAPGREE